MGIAPGCWGYWTGCWGLAAAGLTIGGIGRAVGSAAGGLTVGVVGGLTVGGS
jgi:hypothetical protein